MTLYQDPRRSRPRLLLRSLSAQSTIILLVWLAAFCLAAMFIVLFTLQKGETSLPVYQSMHIMASVATASQRWARAPAVNPSTTPH
jgi:hypothetical protein